jgi:hypothetical protein
MLCRGGLFVKEGKEDRDDDAGLERLTTGDEED